MITIEEIRDFLRDNYDFGFDGYRVGEMPSEKEKIMYLYEVAPDSENQTPTIHFTKTIIIYVHWTNDMIEANQKAMEIYKALFRKCKFKINGKMISFLMTDLPQDNFKDEYNIYNRSIRVKFVE